jgi:hypothetical protein
VTVVGRTGLSPGTLVATAGVQARPVLRGANCRRRRAESGQDAAQCDASAEVQVVHGRLGALEPGRGLGGREADHEPQDRDLALRHRQAGQRREQRRRPETVGRRGMEMSDRLGALDAPPAQLVERGVARHTHQPRLERPLTRLVAIELGQQTQEDGLGEIVGAVRVAKHPVSKLAHAVRVALVQEAHCIAIPVLAARHRRGSPRVF